MQIACTCPLEVGVNFSEDRKPWPPSLFILLEAFYSSALHWKATLKANPSRRHRPLCFVWDTQSRGWALISAELRPCCSYHPNTAPSSTQTTFFSNGWVINITFFLLLFFWSFGMSVIFNLIWKVFSSLMSVTLLWSEWKWERVFKSVYTLVFKPWMLKVITPR